MSARRIAFVSRLDSDCSLGAYLLCEIAPKLIKIYEDIEIYIVGGGEEYKKIRQKAGQINGKYNRELIFAVGYSSDPSAFFTKNTLFIGVSRSAIEAMAHSLPVILLGNEGYMGILSEDNLCTAIKTNLTCRNSKMTVSADVLLSEILRFYKMNEDEQKKLSDFSISVAQKYFSAEECAAQTADFYYEIIKSRQKKQNNNQKRKKIALCGYYGRGNFGDEAILCEILKKIKNASSNPPEISLIKSNEPHKIIPSLFGSDVFIFGGGSLLQNSTSSKSLFFYLAVIFLANALCKEKIMLANGIGPIKESALDKDLLTKMLQGAIKTFDFISVRDKNSQAVLKKLLPSRKIHLIYDPAMIYFLESKRKSNRELICLGENEGEGVGEACKGKPSVEGKGDIVYIPGCRAVLSQKIQPSTLAASLEFLTKKTGIGVTIAVLSKEDENIANKIAKKAEDCKIITINSKNQLISILKQAKICITQRYHGALYSLYCKAPTLILSSDPKAKALCNELGAFPSAPADILYRREALLELCNEAITFAEQNKERIHNEIIGRAEDSDEKLNKVFRTLLK